MTQDMTTSSRMTKEVIDEAEVEFLEIEDKPKKAIQYVDNERLTQEMNDWSVKVREAKSVQASIPQMPKFVAECVMKIATNLTTKHCYSGYSWKSEMIGDAIENCVRYLHNYNPNAKTRSAKPNPFGYISRIVDQSFKNRIEEEKRQIYYKDKSFELMGGMDSVNEADFAEMTDGDACRNALTDMINRAHEYEANMIKRKEKERASAPPKVTTHHSLMEFAL